MNWAQTKFAFEQELEKISEISLMGLSPSSVLEAKVQEPIETPGLKRAKDVLNRSRFADEDGSSSSAIEVAKTAAKRHPKTFTSYANAAAAGASAGILLSSLIPLSNGSAAKIMRGQYRNKITGAGLGALLSLANKALSKNDAAKVAMISPALSLHGSQRVGTIKNTIKSGPKISSQIRGSLIGNKGTVQGV